MVQPSPIKKRNISQFHIEKRGPLTLLSNYDENVFEVESKRPGTSKTTTFTQKGAYDLAQKRH